jgi:8-amino-7-oxononanoate synthase
VATCGIRSVESPVGAEVMIDGRRYINFGGSSYLGLSTHKEIAEAGAAALRSSGSGYQFARETNLASRAHQEAESVAASFFQSPGALYLASGYFFGWVAVAALRKDFRAIFFDEWAHYSLREAIAASGLPTYTYRHLDAEDLEAKLKRHLRANEKPLVVTDGLYATFGEIAPLNLLAQAMMPYGGRLMVDESHSFGVLGETGRGAREHHHLPASIALVGGSTCKALGAVGGIIPASEEEIVAFRATPAARGASMGLPASAAMCAMAIRHVHEHPELLRRLRENTAYLKSSLRRMGLNVGDSIVPIVAFTAGSDESMQALQQRLMSEGIHVFHAKYIGAGSAGVIRCGVFADHTLEHIDRLVETLSRLL